MSTYSPRFPRILFSFLLAVVAAGTALAQTLQWRALPNAPAGQSRLEDLFFINAANGWTVNLAGEIYRTRDGGNTWQLQWRDTTAAFRSIGFADSLRGWAGTVFSPQPLYETVDGGAHWTAVANLPTPPPPGICGLSVVNDSVVYGVGTFYQTAPLIKTTDGGKTWTAIDVSDRAKTLIDVRFFSRDTGFVTGGFAVVGNALADLQAVILFTADGGQSWQTRYHSDSLGSWTWKLAFPSRRTVFASVERISKRRGIVLKSVDGGANWSETFFEGQSDVQGVGFVDSLRGWAGTHDSSYATTDGGATWQPFDFWTGPNAINRIRMLSDTLGYAAGKTVFKFSRSAGAGGLGGPRSARPNTPGPLLACGRPNPFREYTEILYSLDKDDFVTLNIYDIRGKILRTVVQGRQAAGIHRVRLDGRNLRPGPYLARLRAGGAVSALEIWRMP